MSTLKEGITLLSIRAKLEILAGVLAVAGAAFGFTTWLQEHDDRIRALSEVAAAKQVYDQAEQSRKQHEDADRLRDAETAKQLDAMQKLAAQIQTPQQIAAWLPKQFPAMPQPLTITVPPATAQNPRPDAIASIPQADLPALRDAVEKCREDSVKVTSCQADLSSRIAQMKLADTQIDALKNENTSLRTELKGGTFWSRTKRAGKWLLIGALAGGAAVCGSGHCK